jgi:hypothetical protein
MGWRGLLALGGLLLLSSSQVWADAPPATSFDPLVNQLGDDCFEARQAATRALIQRGFASHDALLAGDKHPDPEVRRRARQILVTIREHDYRARLSAFEADPNGRQNHHLPGWSRYRLVIGEAAADRKLFVQMHKSEPAIMTACDSDFPHLAKMLQKRTQELQSLLYTGEDQELTLGTAAVFYFVAADSRVPVSEIAASQICNLFNYRPAVQQAMNAGEYSAPVRKLLGSWVARDVEPMVANQHFVMALQYNLKEALEPALRIVKTTGADAQVRQYAMHVVGRFGTKEHLPVLAPLLEDKTVCMTFEVKPGQTSEIQVRDIALAFAVHLSGQTLSEYGFSQPQKNGQWVYMPGTLRFNEATARDAALKKWASATAAKPAK